MVTLKQRDPGELAGMYAVAVLGRDKAIRERDEARAELRKCFRLMLKIRAGELLPKAQKECDREIERLRKVVGE